MQADDKDFKNELGRIVDLQIWEGSKEEAATRLTNARLAIAGQEREVAFRSDDITELQQKVTHSSYHLLLHCIA